MSRFLPLISSKILSFLINSRACLAVGAVISSPLASIDTFTCGNNFIYSKTCLQTNLAHLAFSTWVISSSNN
ncbi:MAG TPA: hypothetical protein LFW14_06500 [Rickettsia endosymbiont of Degeeriella rufa]|nr:hypothetical protein [Rickettsia endosymbiont of Degeeriella rufa]